MFQSIVSRPMLSLSKEWTVKGPSFVIQRKINAAGLTTRGPSDTLEPVQGALGHGLAFSVEQRR